MKHQVASLAFGLTLAFGLAPAAEAQERPAPPTAAVAVDPAQAALVRRYFAAIHMDKLLDSMVEAMSGPIFEREHIPEDKRDIVRTVLRESYAAVMPELMDMYTELYAGAFTPAEMEAMVAFYESPVGQSVMAKTVQLTRHSDEVYARFAPLLEQELTTRLCARMTCTAPASATSAKRN